MAFQKINILSAAPVNCNVGYNNSWITVSSDAGRELYSQASYITNFDDINISLNASSLSIGSVELNDPDNHNIKASVANIGGGMGALRVLTQDLDSTNDDVSLGDKLGNPVGVNQSLSALKVFIANVQPVSLELYEKPITDTLTITNVLSSKLTGFYVSNLPIAVAAITVVPNSNVSVVVEEYGIFNFQPGISNSGNKQYGIFYKWVKNPTFSVSPTYTTAGNIKYAQFPDNAGAKVLTNGSGKIIHSGLLASSNNVSDESMIDFPIIGNATPDVYALVMQVVNDAGSTDIWYNFNLIQNNL